MADWFDEVPKKLALVALHKTPVINVITELVESFIPATPDERLNAAIVQEEANRVVRLEDRVFNLEAVLAAGGMKLDDLGPTHTTHVAREFVQGTLETRSEEKVEALTNAAARQFDPRLERSVRAHWLSRVRRVSDIELALVALLARYPRDTQFKWSTKGIHVYSMPDGIELPAIELPESTRIAHLEAAAQLRDQPSEHRLMVVGVKGFMLSPSAYQVVRFSSDIENAPTG
jgi:hypothetical protein